MKSVLLHLCSRLDILFKWRTSANVMNRDKLIVLIFYKLCTTRIITSRNSTSIGIDLLPLDVLLFIRLFLEFINQILFYINFILSYYFILSLRRQLVLIIRRNKENLNLLNIVSINRIYKNSIQEFRINIV